MGLKLKIIINPSSGRETARVNIEDMLAYLVSQKKLERADIYYTSAQYDAVNFAKNTDSNEYDYLIAVGGDGTVNEVLTGMQLGGIKLPLAIYTSGTVNDFATINGLPSIPSDFARMLMNPEFKSVDCGKAGDSYFLNVLAGGLMTEIAYTVPSELKTAFGPAAYWMSAMKDIPTINKTIPLKITTENEVYETDAVMFLISNTKSVGGFRKLMTMADLSDGLLDILVLKKMEIGDIVPLLGNLVLGDHIHNDKVIYVQSNKFELSTTSNELITLDVDGEKGPTLPTTVECIKDAVTLIIPGKEVSL